MVNTKRSLAVRALYFAASELAWRFEAFRAVGAGDFDGQGGIPRDLTYVGSFRFLWWQGGCRSGGQRGEPLRKLSFGNAFGDGNDQCVNRAGFDGFEHGESLLGSQNTDRGGPGIGVEPRGSNDGDAAPPLDRLAFARINDVRKPFPIQFDVLPSVSRGRDTTVL